MALPSQISIGPHTVGGGGPVLVIAEAGVNHNGDVELAKQLVREAKAAGADCVKFQTFRADQIATQTAPKAAYQLRTTDPDQSQLDMLRAFELSRDDYEQIVRVCRDEQIVFLSTPYGFEDVERLESLDVPAYKIASGQAVEPVFLEYIARKGKPVILSTGMCTLAEVQRAVQTIRDAGNEQIVVLQCTTNYPSSIDDTNLRAMTTMRDELGVLIGYSDHTPSLTAATVAVGLGACVIERHFTIDNQLPGPDQACSSDPREFGVMVKTIREAQRTLGSDTKSPTTAERENMSNIRRGVYATKPIATNSPFTLDYLAVKRPVAGIGGDELSAVLGKRAAVDIAADTPIQREMIT